MDTQVLCGECEGVIADGAEFFAVKINDTMKALCEICAERLPSVRVLFKDFTPKTIANPKVIMIGIAVLCQAAKDGFKPVGDPEFGINAIYIREAYSHLLNGQEA